jgi:hypothetical protein
MEAQNPARPLMNHFTQAGKPAIKGSHFIEIVHGLLGSSGKISRLLP